MSRVSGGPCFFWWRSVLSSRPGIQQELFTGAFSERMPSCQRPPASGSEADAEDPAGRARDAVTGEPATETLSPLGTWLFVPQSYFHSPKQKPAYVGKQMIDGKF